MRNEQTNLTGEQIQKLTRIQRYATRYELAMIKGNERILIRYTAKKTRRSILKECYEFGEKIVAITGVDEIKFADTKTVGATSGEWEFKFTGRTQREAIIGGELPFIGAK